MSDPGASDAHPVRWWSSLTTVEAGRIAASDPVLVLPLAATEQHGSHLPLSTDLDIGLGLLAEAFGRLPTSIPAWALPARALGCSREHARFAGTLSVEPDELVASIEATGRALSRFGVRRLVLSNSHGGNRHAMEAAGLRLREELGMLVVHASWFRFPRPDVALPEAEWRHGLHGGALETAMMLRLRPDLVRPDQIARARSLGEDLADTLQHVGPEGLASFSWLAGDLNPAGVVGDATLATAELGQRCVGHYGAVLAQVIEDAARFPMDRLAEDAP